MMIARRRELELALGAIITAALLETLGVTLPHGLLTTLLTWPAFPGLMLGFFAALTMKSVSGSLAALMTVSLMVNGGIYYFFFRLLRKVRVELRGC